MAVLGTMFAGSYLAMGGGSKPKTAAGPPINASSKEEGDFIQYVTPGRKCRVEFRSIAINEAKGSSYPHWGCSMLMNNRNFLKEVDGDKKSEKH